ncbi:MAG: DUF1559 domain-containing protein [Chitinophagia bacterium]|nr:DUF1559 domain-containing protein [Chitinophagia bacterium]
MNAAATSRRLSAITCPADGNAATTFGAGATAHSYVACTGNGVYVATAAGWNTSPPVTPQHSSTIGIVGINTILGGGAIAASTSGSSSVSGSSTTIPVWGTGQAKLAPPPVPLFRGGAFLMSGGSEALSPAEDPKLLRDAVEVKLADITDGLSKTLAFSEVIRPRGQDPTRCTDFRGLSWWGPGALFSTCGTPNSPLPDVLPRAGDCASDEYAPCNCPHTSSRPIAVLARSRHPGGVVAAKLDGSVEFYTDDVDAIIWENLGTGQGDRQQ